MYRLDGWDKYEEFEKSDVCDSKDASLIEIFEAGADAMLKALWKMAEESPTKTFTIDSRVVNVFEDTGG